jgi:uroporphyrinogen-III synthase
VSPLRLLVTRPEPDAQRTATALRARGHDVLVAPLLRFEPIANARVGEGPWAGLLMTSANAARAAALDARLAQLVHLPVVAVGHHTAEAARRAGFGHVVSAEGDADDLARVAAGRFRGTAAPLLYLAGEDQAVDLAHSLAAQGVPIRTAVIYRMTALLELPGDVAAALRAGEVDGVLHYSRRSADVYLQCGETAGVGTVALLPTHYCLSAEIAAPLARAGAVTLRIAARPEEQSLFALVDSA